MWSSCDRLLRLSGRSPGRRRMRLMACRCNAAGDPPGFAGRWSLCGLVSRDTVLPPAFCPSSSTRRAVGCRNMLPAVWSYARRAACSAPRGRRVSPRADSTGDASTAVRTVPVDLHGGAWLRGTQESRTVHVRARDERDASAGGIGHSQHPCGADVDERHRLAWHDGLVRGDMTADGRRSARRCEKRPADAQHDDAGHRLVLRVASDVDPWSAVPGTRPSTRCAGRDRYRAEQ